jgi:diguanylate cyclase (GGDEF)-like protein/PAS domain S-box-containing protein
MTAMLAAGLVVAVLASIVATVLAGAALRFRRQAAEANEKKFNILEAVGDGIYFVDHDLRITHVNGEAERLLRRTADTLVGQRLEAIVDPLASELVPEIRVARQAGAAVPRTQAFPATRTWVEIRIHAAAAESLISLRDVSERTRAELRLQESEKRLRLVTQHVDAVLWTTDREGRFTTVSGGALDELGLSADAMIARSSEVFVDPDVLDGVFAGTAARVESSRSERWLRHHIEPVADVDRNVVGTVGISIDISELKRAQQLLFEAAHRDRLTGLPNRLALEQRLSETVAAAELGGRRFAVLFVDLDRFKNVNDTLGHTVGDEVLREVATRLGNTVRGIDTVARPGGDEFIVLLPGVRDADEVRAVAQRLLRVLDEPMLVRGREIGVTASIGVAMFPDDGRNGDDVVSRADVAMYRAKHMGGNRLALFDASMERSDIDRLSLESHLRHAAERGELLLRFQPIVKAATKELVGCEALVRWRHPTQGIIAPDAFIPLAEQTGAIIGIDRWVLGEACAAAARMREILPEFRIAINLSTRDLCESDLPDAVAEALDRHGIPPGALRIEITETVSLDDSVLPVLRRLFALGVEVALDDFGIGYSSLSYLKRLPITALKIDRTFVRGVIEDRYDQAIVGSILAVGKALGLVVVAEGVETDAQFDRISAMGCDEVQGFVIGRPMVLEALLSQLERARGSPCESSCAVQLTAV